MFYQHTYGARVPHAHIWYCSSHERPPCTVHGLVVRTPSNARAFVRSILVQYCSAINQHIWRGVPVSHENHMGFGLTLGHMHLGMRRQSKYSSSGEI